METKKEPNIKWVIKYFTSRQFSRKSNFPSHRSTKTAPVLFVFFFVTCGRELHHIVTLNYTSSTHFWDIKSLLKTKTIIFHLFASFFWTKNGNNCHISVPNIDKTSSINHFDGKISDITIEKCNFLILFRFRVKVFSLILLYVKKSWMNFIH